MRKLTLSFLFLTLIFAACEKKTEEKSTKDTTPVKREESTSTVKNEIDLIKDSVNTAWNNMIASDDQKIKDIERLLLEISYTSDYDVALYDSLVKEVKMLKTKRYDESLNLDQMDAYDQMSDDLIRKVLVLKSKSKEIKQHPLADELVKDINKANSVEITVALRNSYDYWAKAYNQYLSSHKDELQKMGEPYASLKPKEEIVK